MAGEVTVEGLEAAQAAYAGIASDAKDMTEAHRAMADAGAQAARARAPVRSGALSGSIDGTATAQDAKLSVGVPYWPYLEYGTKFLNARRYMRAGIDAMERTAPGAYEQRMAAIIAKRVR